MTTTRENVIVRGVLAMVQGRHHLLTPTECQDMADLLAELTTDGSVDSLALAAAMLAPGPDQLLAEAEGQLVDHLIEHLLTPEESFARSTNQADLDRDFLTELGEDPPGLDDPPPEFPDIR